MPTRFHPLAALLAGCMLASCAGAATPQRETFHDLQVDVVGTGRPVLMIPGLNSAGSTWTPTCAALQPGVQCHILQLPGFAGTPAIATDHYMEAMRDRVIDYVAAKHLGAPVVVGHSLGGEIALMVAAKAPASVDRLVIVDSLPFFALVRDPSATAQSAQAAAQAIRAQMLKSTPEQAEAGARAAAVGMAHSAEDVERVVQWSRQSDRATTAEAFAEVLGIDLRPELAHIDRPTLVLGAWAAYAPMGATMDSTRQIFETQYANLKGVRIHMSERGYHFLMWDDPDWLVAQLKSFIAEK